MNTTDIKDSGIILFDEHTFELIHNSLYEQIMQQLVHEVTEPIDEVEEADHFILKFYELFENSKKLIIFDSE